MNLLISMRRKNTEAEEREDQNTGEIKISTLNKQRQAHDPPIDRGARKKALGVVKKHLEPHLKKHGLRLAEQEMEKLIQKTTDELNQLGILL